MPSDHIRRYLIERCGERCQVCNWAERNPRTGRIPIHLDHIDGNARNNTAANLRFLCPNHHALTETFGNANKGNGRPGRRARYLRTAAISGSPEATAIQMADRFSADGNAPDNGLRGHRTMGLFLHNTAIIRVHGPAYRLDLTVDVLRRIASNAVDVVVNDAYYRALTLGGETHVVRVVQTGPQELELQTSADSADVMPVLRRMLGLEVDLTTWDARAARVPWLAPFALAYRGVRPPRYPTLWEACAHAIVFQQISIHAAGAIMRRMVESIGAPAVAGEIPLRAFPTPAALLAADDAALRASGLSMAKRSHLRSVAAAIESGELDAQRLEPMTTQEAAVELGHIRGIGPWSAAIILLRGFGRLDIFPMRDSGAARTIKALSGASDVDLDAVLEALGDARGMLYFHLLLGRLHPLPQPSN